MITSNLNSTTLLLSAREGRKMRHKREEKESSRSMSRRQKQSHQLVVVVVRLIKNMIVVLASFVGFSGSLVNSSPQQQHLLHSSSSSALPDSSQHFSCGKLYYRTFYLDQQRNVLFVGAMDNIFKVNLANVNKTNCLDDAIRLEAQKLDTSKCTTKGKSENFDCRNHVKVIQPISRSGERLYVCGTNAYNPRDYLLLASNLSLAHDPPPGVGGGAPGECPFDPDDNSTAIWVERGNPSDLPALYTGTVTDSNKADALIFRTELYNQSSGLKVHEAKRTTRFEPKSLDKPNFVGSFEIGDYVYFFFRESAYEFINCGKSIYSRVARVCKRDNGYKLYNEKMWTTYLKARLNCSIPGEFPFYFDEIQSIYRNPYDDKKFHAVFTTSNNGLTGSAICTFSLDAIQEAFSGKFKEQKSSDQAWLPVPSYKLNQNEPRPGSCVDDSLSLSDQLVTFIRGHPLMDSAVASDNGKPIFYRRNTIFTKIVVDIIEIDGIRYTVYFAGTNTGHVYKIVEWYPSGSQLAGAAGSSLFTQPSVDGSEGYSSSTGFGSGGGGSEGAQSAQSSLVEVIEATVPEPVRAMEISSRHKSLYVASDSQIKQINLLNCRARHESCMQCVRDPYCGWDRKHLECRHFSHGASSSLDGLPSLIQDVTNETPDLCHTLIKHKDVRVTWGQSVHLPCPFNGFIQESQDLQQLLSAQQRSRSFQLHRQQPDLSWPAPISSEQVSGPDLMGQSHGLAQPANFIQWYYHRLDNVLSTPGYPVLQHRDRFILAANQGLVIMNAKEPGWYQCRLGNQIIYSYNLIIDTITCAAPNEAEYPLKYANWCREWEQYKKAARSWHAKQNQCQAFLSSQQQQQQQQQQHHQLSSRQDVWSMHG